MFRSLPSRLAIAALVIVLVLALWSLGRDRSFDAERPSTSPSIRHSAQATGHPHTGIRAVVTDPASPPLQWVREGEEIAPLENAVDVYTLATDDESMEELMGFLEWSSSLGKGGSVGLEMARCAARFEPELESPCGWNIEAVLRRTTEDTGVIVYARAVVTEGHEQPACRAMASCCSEVWAHREQAPMPSRLGEELQFSTSGRNSFWTADRGTDASTYYRNAAMGERRSFEKLAAVPHDPDHISPASIGWNLAFFQHRIDEFECMLDVIEDRPDPCGT